MRTHQKRSRQGARNGKNERVHLALAGAYFDEGRWDAALEETERALAALERAELVGREAGRDRVACAIQARQIRCQSYLLLGRVEEYVEEARRILQIAPNVNLHNQLLLTQNFRAGMTPEILYEETCRWNAMYAAPLKEQILRHENQPDPERRIKIGYVSPDFRNHALMKVMLQVLERHDRSQFEIFAYAVGPESDGITEMLAFGLNNHFVRLPFSRKDIVERVRADGVDILVDLAGHTIISGDAYLAFALKPAPIQVSWLGIWSTTGLSTMDYFFGGPDIPYPGTEHLFSEKVYRLPRIPVCHRPFDRSISVSPSPYFYCGHITFGCFNNPYKVTREVVKLWAAILHLVPCSRILLKFSGLEKPLVRERFYRWFGEDGIPPERLSFQGAGGSIEYLRSWNEVDIALDPFPYSGGTTTLDTLWMGVPVVTLNGRFSIQACGANIVRTAGLPVAETPKEYIELAVSLAEIVPREPGLRSRVRESFRESPLMDEAGLVQAVETAYRDMWRTWCGTRV